MAQPNEIPYWQVSTQKGNEKPRIEFLNALQIAARRKMGVIISGEATEANMYFKTGENTYTPAKKKR